MKPKASLPTASATILLLAAVAHLAVLAVGERGAAAMGAPPWILDSLNAGTWLAPAIILGIACVLAYAAACVLSLAGSFKRELPLSRACVTLFALAMLLRGAALPVIAIVVPAARPDIGLFETSIAVGAALLGASLLAVVARYRGDVLA